MPPASASSEDPPIAAESTDLRRVRDSLWGLGFTEGDLPRTVGLTSIDDLLETPRDLLLGRTKSDAPAHVLLRLFHLSEKVPERHFRGALPRDVPEVLVRCGVIRVDDGTVEPLVRITPYAGLLVASDLPYDRTGIVPTDHVLGVSTGTLALGSMVIRRRFGSALDLCSGTGVLALQTARHCERVTGSDVNPRALAFARFNALLNDARNIRWVQGDLLEPVRSSRFDLVMCNPPFVIGPSLRYAFRDSGASDDDMVRSIIEGVPSLLEDGGWFIMLCNWAHVAGAPWRERIAGWIPDGCSTWILRMETLDPEVYATRWVMLTERDADPNASARWSAALVERGIEGISAGVVVIRKRSDRETWFRTDDFPGNVVPPAGESIVRVFENRDFLFAVDDATLLGTAFRPAPDAALQHESAPGPAGWLGAVTSVRLVTGLAYTARMEGPLGEIVARCDGKAPLGEIIAVVAHSVDADPLAVTPAAVMGVRSLIDRGFLVPVGENDLS